MTPSKGEHARFDPSHAAPTPATRRMRRRKLPLAMALNLAPMIDITFLLLIFFLVTTTFKRAEGVLAAKMPEDSGVSGPALPISPIIVRIRQPEPSSGHYVIQIDNAVRQPLTFDELAQFLVNFQANPGFDRQTPVVIYPEVDVKWDYVVNGWNAAVRAQCANITFAGG